MKQLFPFELEKIGFKKTEQFDHDDFFTTRYVKGIITVEFTYEEAGKLLTTELTVKEINCMNIDNILPVSLMDAVLNEYDEHE